MPVSRRYTPEHPPQEACLYGLDYSFVIPPGVGISHGFVEVWLNTVVPTIATNWAIGDPVVLGRAIYCRLTGGTEGQDYQLRWSVTDTDGNDWPRICLVLCAQTS